MLTNYVVANNLAEGAGYSDALEYFANNVAELSRATLGRYGDVRALRHDQPESDGEAGRGGAGWPAADSAHGVTQGPSSPGRPLLFTAKR